ncbi:MAG: ribosome small subunit-dependent GTPase A [Clostridia bacterium]|nr:ribosome small subunit-dependent GTPase A [Clostridia bacterium]
MPEGILIRGIGSFYTAQDADGAEFILRAKKKFRHQGQTPIVGDRVRFTPGMGEEEGWIEELLPRRSVFVRPPVANVETLLIVLCPEPEPDFLLAERLLVECRRQGIRSVLVAAKSDLGDGLAERLRREYALAEAPVYAVSARTGEGLDALREAMRGSLCCLAGQSGVGKSTLLTALTGIDLETGEISRKIARGKNTTRRAELLSGNGLRVFDTAGFSLLALTGRMEPEQLRLYYPEFLEHEGTCRFDPCLHDREPGCSVTAAVREGLIPAARQARYRQLLAEVREAWDRRYD